MTIVVWPGSCVVNASLNMTKYSDFDENRQKSRKPVKFDKVVSGYL